MSLITITRVKKVRLGLGKLRHFNRGVRRWDRWNRQHRHGWMKPADGVWRVRHG